MERLTKHAVDRIEKVVLEWERFGRPLRALLRPPPAGRIFAARPVQWARVATSITAASGLQKGKGTVDLLVDDGTGAGTDRVLQAGVTVWNGYQTQIDPASSAGKIRRVQVKIIDGLLQILNADCPVS